MFIIKEGTASGTIGQGTEDTTRAAIIGWLGSQGFTVRTAEQDKGYVNTNVQEEVNKMFAKSKVELEEKVKELTGIDRQGEGEKATDYLVRAVNQRIGELPTLQAKLKKLEEEGLQGNEQATEYKTQLEKLQSDYQALKTEMDEKLSNKDKEIFMNRVRHQQNNELAKLRPLFDQSIKAEFMEDIVKSRLEKFRSENTPHQLEDQIIYKDGQGNTKTSQQDGKPMSTSEVLLPYFKEIIDETRKAAGAGSNGQGGTGGNGQNKTQLQKPEGVTTRVKLHEWLSSKEGPNLNESTAEFSEAFNELGKDLPIR